MIRYAPLTRAQLEARVDAVDETWRSRASVRRAAFIAAGKFSEESSIWSDVKTVFMDLQYDKCVFCERVLGGKLAGKSEHDVEHFRPKGRIKKWPYATRKPKVAYDFDTGLAVDTGYYWLAYDVENYACACKGCNSDRKRDYFPILGPRGAPVAAIAALNGAEIPLLLFPHGEHGDEPSAFITFEGVIAKPVHGAGLAFQRARVTIDFFSLNDREELLADRARVIRELFKAMRLTADVDPAIRATAERDILAITSDMSPQAACARAYLALAKSDPQKAWEIYRDIDRYLKPAH
ncbi:hypothetical protein ELH33_33070 (plasmid) [Rhizobium ruizarguesonis]|uniref:hypothetical protein n=1 Tax=Rhizobium ruizarguesonis TaxID=2081791 RepID=UPI001030DDE4|nr:hypothetical protein [Rhizobium ruizarguesonis]TBC25608.1 hypothetical protein ELH33_33070 [Rhizobium ruizarguesonis]